jgi:hypothetical protein
MMQGGAIESRRLACGLLVAILTIAGCNGDDDGSHPTATATVPSSTATPDDPTNSPAPTDTPTVPSSTATPDNPTNSPAPTDTPAPTEPATPDTQTPTISPTPTATPSGTAPPNIVLVILDDVGIDQVAAFGLGQGNIASTPNLSALANAGVRFSSTWSMPECSPSRATIFTGRYPLRHGVTSALISNMLPQAQVSPYETTLPRVLREAGYTSAMVGKYHLGNRNPAGNCSPQTTGFDFFDGNMEAGPPSLDRQAGHVEDGAADDFSCGFQQMTFNGNCYFEDGSCRSDTVDVPNDQGGTRPAPVSGRNCIEARGIFVREEGDCQSTRPATCPDAPTRSDCVEVGEGTAFLDFERPNGYYAWPETVLTGALPPETTEFTDPECGEPPLDRQYMTIAQTSDAIGWYNEQSGPRMLTVSYNSIHTPYQQAPQSLATLPSASQLVCGALPSDRLLGNNMLESMDREIGRLLASLGLATLDGNGTVQTAVDDDGNVRIPELQASNTMVAVVGDNGTFFEVVKPPFGVLRSKGSVYETGVRVPLIVSGPLVDGRTGREVDALVNVADLFELFAEVGGVDVREAVPPAHVLDSRPLLPYLTNPDQEPIRETNFTQLGPGVFELPVNEETRSWPCLLQIAGAQVCNEVIADTQSFCNTNSGVWWGPTENPEQEVVAAIGDEAARQGIGSCCQVNVALQTADLPTAIFSPIEQFAVRNRTYKLVELHLPDCSADDGSFPPANLRIRTEFYDLTAATKTNPLALDAGSANLLCTARMGQDDPTCLDGSACDTNQPTSCLAANQMTTFDALHEELNRLLDSEPTCEGDGNLDRRVDQRDADGVAAFSTAVSPLTLEVGGQSFFDLNTDAETDEADAEIVAANLGTDCIGACRRADLNRDGNVDDADAGLLAEASGACDLCGADLNGDGTVDGADQAILDEQRGCSTPTATRTRVPTQPAPTQTITPEPFCENGCAPDATGRLCGCPLFVADETTIPPEAGIDCDLVCEQYSTCQHNNIQIGYTCDATLCTSSDPGLETEACFGLQSCDVGEILRAEAAAGCSCCASQLCRCEADALTNQSVAILNAEQRDRGETPQCDVNGTLCGD